MTTPTSEFFDADPYGTDCEWYASDAAGHVAVFTTAGIGPMPVEVVGNLQVTASLQELVHALPTRGTANLLVSLPSSDSFMHFANRGLFAYDWQDVHRTLDLSERYEMLCRPNNPIQVAELSEPIQSLLRRVAVPGVRFAESLTLDIRKLFTCLPAE